MDSCHLNTGAIILWYNGSYTMMAKPITALDLHYPMIQFLMKINVYVVVNFLSQVIFVFLLFLGMVMYANEVETKEK